MSEFLVHQQGRIQDFPKGGVETHDTKCRGGGGAVHFRPNMKSGGGGGAVGRFRPDTQSGEGWGGGDVYLDR